MGYRTESGRPMNHKTRQLARELYEDWCEQVITYAPPGISHLGSFDEQRSHFMARAVKLKKTLEYRRDPTP